MDTITGTVYRILWQPKSEDNHFKVFSLKCSARKNEIVTGDFPDLIEGAEIEVHGEFKDHPRYGRGFRATAHTYVYDKNSVVSTSLYIQSIAKFMGPKRSYAVASKFKDNLEEIIEKYPDKLLEVEDIGKKVASQLVDAWHANKEEKNVRIFLHSLGISNFKIKKIMSSLGLQAEEKIKENPYLLSMIGFGFGICDHIAKKLKLDPKSAIRKKYYITYLLKEVKNSGHLYLKMNQIIKGFNNYNEITSYKFKNSEIVEEDIRDPLLSLIDEGFIIKQDGVYYDVQMYFFESESARTLKFIHDKKDLYHNLNDTDFDSDKYIKEYEKEQREITGIKDFKLSDAQRDAIVSFIKEKILIITGSPGTGKTTVLKSLVEICIKKNLNFELLTPTGIAAKKLANTAGYEAYTIHRRLAYDGDKWGYDSYRKYSTDVVIIDEMSMVDMELFYRLVSALYPETKLVLVGDNDQLPSVGPGKVLDELIKSKQFKTISLQHIFRQAAQSDIIKEAKRIKDGDIDLELFSDVAKNDIWFLRSTNIPWIQEQIINLAKKLKDRVKDNTEKKTFQLISPRNAGPLSVTTLNEALQSALNPKKPDSTEITVNNTTIRTGDRILIKKNNYDLDIFNGDMGKVTRIKSGFVTVEIVDINENREVNIPIEQSDDLLKLGYCITCHKSQGAEYDLVILPIIRSHGSRILQRNLLYTAITRAKKKVIVLGESKAIVQAIENDKIQERNTMFSKRICLWMSGQGTTLQELYKNPNDYQNAEHLKRLLLYEEKISSVSDTTRKSYEENTEKESLNNTPSKPTQSSRPVKLPSLTKLLKEIDGI